MPKRFGRAGWADDGIGPPGPACRIALARRHRSAALRPWRDLQEGDGPRPSRTNDGRYVVEVSVLSRCRAAAAAATVPAALMAATFLVSVMVLPAPAGDPRPALTTLAAPAGLARVGLGHLRRRRHRHGGLASTGRCARGDMSRGCLAPGAGRRICRWNRRVGVHHAVDDLGAGPGTPSHQTSTLLRR
jgi:hypothetical protein